MTARKRILIVDDSEENVLFLTQILEDHGHDHGVARDGREALAAMRRSRPDLVLLDIMMPRKSGINVYHDMKKDPALRDIPIIIVTGASRITGVDMRTGESRPSLSYGDDLALDLGAILRDRLGGIEPEGFIEKPIDPAVLAGKLRELLA